MVVLLPAWERSPGGLQVAAQLAKSTTEESSRQTLVCATLFAENLLTFRQKVPVIVQAALHEMDVLS